VGVKIQVKPMDLFSLDAVNGREKVIAEALKLKIARVIGEAVWDQRGDIRDVISIGKLVRKNDGPEEVEKILSTMIKYGEIRPLKE